MKVVIALVTLVMLMATPALAAETTDVSSLLNNPAALSGEKVTVSGELIGDYGFRDDGTVWTQLNGDAYADTPLRDGGHLSGGNLGIGIHGDATLFEDLDPPGRYNQVGPLVTVTGTWRYHDTERGEETYLEVDTLTVLRNGYPLPESSSMATIVVGALLVLAAAGLLVAIGRRS